MFNSAQVIVFKLKNGILLLPAIERDFSTEAVISCGTAGAIHLEMAYDYPDHKRGSAWLFNGYTKDGVRVGVDDCLQQDHLNGLHALLGSVLPTQTPADWVELLVSKKPLPTITDMLLDNMEVLLDYVAVSDAEVQQSDPEDGLVKSKRNHLMQLVNVCGQMGVDVFPWGASRVCCTVDVKAIPLKPLYYQLQATVAV